MAKKYLLLDYERSEDQKLWQPARRANLAILDFGFTFGIIWALLVIVLTAVSRNGRIDDFVNFLATIYPGYSRPPACCFEWSGYILGGVYGFLHGFLFGLLVGYLYNILHPSHPCGVKLLEDITASTKPVRISDGEGDRPYTIVIIANPILQGEHFNEDDDEFKPDPEKLSKDPILNLPKLFQAKVACIIGSLANNDMIRTEFLEKIRITTLFDASLANQLHERNALCLEQSVDVIIEPIQIVWTKASGIWDPEQNRLTDFLKGYGEFKDGAGNVAVDVVYAITASPTHTRSSALYTLRENVVARVDLHFKFEYDNDGDESTPSRVVEKHHTIPPNAPEMTPGMIAYSAWDNRLKTPLHEFAHAMSSADQGLIHDEYYDDIDDSFEGVLLINKRVPADRRAEAVPAQENLRDRALPRLFATYTHRDKVLPAPTDTIRYQAAQRRAIVPARSSPRVPCTMDFSAEHHRFDPMIEQFIRDRLSRKIERP